MLTDLPPNTGLLAVEIRLTGDPDPMFVTQHLLHDAAGLPSQVEVQDIWDVLAEALEPCTTEDYSFPGGRFIYRDNAALGQPTNSFVVSGGLGVGNIVGEPVPPNVATLVRKNTSDFGRGANGRFYIPGVPEAEVDKNGTLASAYIANCQSAVDAMTALWQAIGTGWTPVVVHHGPAPDHDVEPSGIITGYAVQTLAATQRRRLR